MEPFDLLSTVEYGGCSSKVPAAVLESILLNLPKLSDPNILVDIDTHDDAGVYRINEQLALIVTTDFFPPICSDAVEFGQIAAANSLSDVYAMGGEPFLVLNISMFPSSKIPIAVYKDILEGAADKVSEAGAITMGGHTIDDYPPKFGLAVVGKVKPDRLITNAGLRVGDKLILTKPLGSGVVVAAQRIGMVSDEAYCETLSWMKVLNRSAAEVMQRYNVRGATDITGFGLLGHAYKMAKASGVNLSLKADAAPMLPEVYNLIDDGCIPGASFRNLEYLGEHVSFGSTDYNLKMLLSDAQTSGGILMGVQPEHADEALADLKRCGLSYSAIIGQVDCIGDGLIVVT